MILILIVLLIAIAVGLLIYALIPKQKDVLDRVAQLSGEESRVAQRIVVFERIYDDKSKSAMQQRLNEAGWYKVTPAKMALGLSCGLASGTGLAFLLIGVLHVDGPLKYAAYLLVILGYYAPKYTLNKAVKTRKESIQSEIPDFIDSVSTTVAAGIALNGALMKSVDLCTGPLGDEFRATLADIRMGRSRAAALSALAERVNQTDLSLLVTSIIQSEKIGGNIAQVLEDLANESRERRLMRAEEIAGSLPVKMTIPMATLLLPALFTVILGPVVAGMKDGF